MGVRWGPIAYPMRLINWTAGYWQVLVGAIAIVALFILERRAGWSMLVGSISNLLDMLGSGWSAFVMWLPERWAWACGKLGCRVIEVVERD